MDLSVIFLKRLAVGSSLKVPYDGDVDNTFILQPAAGADCTVSDFFCDRRRDIVATKLTSKRKATPSRRLPSTSRPRSPGQRENAHEGGGWVKVQICLFSFYSQPPRRI